MDMTIQGFNKVLYTHSSASLMIKNFSHTSSLKFIFLACLLWLPSMLKAESPKWKLVIHEHWKEPSLNNFAKRNHALFQHFLDSSLEGKGKKTFLTVSKRVKNNIFWKGENKENIYLDAFKRSYPVVRQFKRKNIPEIVFLIPYLESLWRSKSGKPSSDYGYWQLVRSTVEEIQELDTTPESIRQTHPNKIRSNPHLSTEAALIHLRRYYFYFAKVAEHPETDSWLFAMLSYNWGAGNVKRMLLEMEDKHINPTFSNFYDYLYRKHRANRDDRSMQAAVEYLPSLWNIAQLIYQSK